MIATPSEYLDVENWAYAKFVPDYRQIARNYILRIIRELRFLPNSHTNPLQRIRALSRIYD
jgi:hypothetical protein